MVFFLLHRRIYNRTYRIKFAKVIFECRIFALQCLSACKIYYDNDSLFQMSFLIELIHVIFIKLFEISHTRSWTFLTSLKCKIWLHA